MEVEAITEMDSLCQLGCSQIERIEVHLGQSQPREG